MNFSNAFTMVELIFVIVIIGILSAVAIPKFTATRNDAKVSEVAMNVMQGASEIASYAVAHADTDNNLSKMSNGIASLVRSGNAELNTTGRSANIKVGNVANCITVKIEHGDLDDNLTITTHDTEGDTLCTSLQSIIDTSKYPMKLRGASVKY